MSAVLLHWLGVGLAVALAGLHAFGAYALALLVCAAVRPRPQNRGSAKPAAAEGGRPRIAALVIAHDEERVVLHSVESLARQSYPSDRFRVIVVADHCQDATSRVARDAGAEVIERSGGTPEGKTAAVLFGVQYVRRSGGFDAVAIFDADNHVDPEFLSRVADRLSAGERIVQGLVDAKNPGASWVSGSSALGFWAIATVAQAPRERLGFSVPAMGTGLVMTLADATALLERSESLTDDLEFGARVALSGFRVAFAENAVTHDEKPLAMSVAASQRQRWMQGRWAVAERYVPELLREAVSGSGPFGVRLRRLDVAVQLLSPSLLFIGVATVGLGLLLLAVAGSETALARYAWASLGLGTLYYWLPMPFMVRFRPPVGVWACYVLQPLYLSLSAPLAVTGFFARRRKVWWRTPKG